MNPRLPPAFRTTAFTLSTGRRSSTQAFARYSGKSRLFGFPCGIRPRAATPLEGRPARTTIAVMPFQEAALILHYGMMRVFYVHR